MPVDDSLDVVEFLFCIGPENQSLLQQVKGPLHDFLVVLVVAIVQGHFDEEIEANLCGSFVVSCLQGCPLLGLGCTVLHHLFHFLEFPLDVDEAHVRCNFLHQGVR